MRAGWFAIKPSVRMKQGFSIIQFDHGWEFDCSQVWTLKANLQGSFQPGRHREGAAVTEGWVHTDQASSYFSTTFLLFNFGHFLNSSETWFSHL